MGASGDIGAHFPAAMAVLAEHAGGTGIVAHGDRATVTAVGRGGREFNTGWVTGRPSAPEAAVAWMCGRLERIGQPFMVQVPDRVMTDLTPALAAAGLRRHETVPAMVRDATVEVPATPPGIRVERVTDPTALEAHAIAAATGFGAPDPRALLGVFPPSLLDDERVTMLNGHVDGAEAPTATAVSVLVEGVAGIYAVTVHESARRRGFGTVMTWMAIAAGARRGAAVAALQATAMGEPVYARMGFRTYERHHRFSRPDPVA